MNTTHLKYFHDVYQFESVIEAAKINNVAASTISQALRALENDFGFELTSKQRGQLKLSEKAQAVAQKIPSLLLQIEEIRSFGTSKLSVMEGELRIATHQSLLASHLWMPIRAFKKNYPKVDLGLFTGVGPHLSNLLGQENIDIIISLEHPGRGHQLKSHLLHEGFFVLTGRSGLQFSKKSTVVVTSKSKLEVQYLIKNNPWLQIEELTNWSTIKSVIQHEDVFGFLPDYLVQQELRTGSFSKVSKVKKQDYKFQISSWFKKENSSNQMVLKFNKLAEESFQQMK